MENNGSPLLPKFQIVTETSEMVHKLCACGHSFQAVKGSASDMSSECERCYRQRMWRLEMLGLDPMRYLRRQ